MNHDKPPTAQPLTAAQYGCCSNILRNLGKSYPRTCAECGLGPCKTQPSQSVQPSHTMKFSERCRLSEHCLPDAPYRTMLTALHNEMLTAQTVKPAVSDATFWNALSALEDECERAVDKGYAWFGLDVLVAALTASKRPTAQTVQPIPEIVALRKDAGRWRRLVNASEMSFPVLTIANDPENDCTLSYGRNALENLVDACDEISDENGALPTQLESAK